MKIAPFFKHLAKVVGFNRRKDETSSAIKKRLDGHRYTSVSSREAVVTPDSSYPRSNEILMLVVTGSVSV